MQQQNTQKLLIQTEQGNQLSEITQIIKQLIDQNKILTTFLIQATQGKEFFSILDDQDEQTEISYKLSSFLEYNDYILTSLENHRSQEKEGIELLQEQLRQQNIKVSSGNLNFEKSDSFHLKNPNPEVNTESQISTVELAKRGKTAFLSQYDYEFILNILFYFVSNYNGNKFFDCKIVTKEEQIIKNLETLWGFQQVAEGLKVLFQEINKQ